MLSSIGNSATTKKIINESCLLSAEELDWYKFFKETPGRESFVPANHSLVSNVSIYCLLS